MNSGITKRTLFLKCVLLFLCMPAATALLSGACPQTPPSPASEEPAERQISTTENLPELVRSLNELQALQLSHGYQYYKVDLEAQLLFTAPYWTVFFVQDGHCAAMISCTNADTSKLVEQKVGCKLRIAGLAGKTPAHVNMTSFEIVDSSTWIEPTVVSNLATKQALPMNTLVEFSCEIAEIFVSQHGTLLFAQAGSVPVELEVNEPMEISELAHFHNRTTSAQGCLSLPPEPNHPSEYVLRMMHKGQLLAPSPADSLEQVAKRFTPHAGKVLYSDARAEFVVETGGQVRVVRSHFAYRLNPGDRVLIHESASLLGSASSSSIDSGLVELLSHEPLTSGKLMSVNELLNSPAIPNRVALTAKVESMDAKDGVFKFTLTSQGEEFYAAMPANALSLDALGIRVGDLVFLTGAPLIEASPAPSGLERTLKLFVASKSDLKFEALPTQISLFQIALFFLTGCALLGSALTWNWLLRKQVHLRTARLNEITSHLRKSFEAVREGVLVNDGEQKVSGFNQQFANMFGTQPMEGQLINTHLNSIEDQLVNRVDFARIRQSVQDNKLLPATGVFELRSPQRTFQVFTSVIVDADGSYHGNLWSFEDITEKLSLENRLIQSQKMEAIGQLSGGIAHDFNNLLTIIRSSLMMLKHSAKTNTPATEFAEAADAAVDRAAELTQHLLDFSRRSTLRLQIVDANTLLKQVYFLIRRSIDSSIDLQLETIPQPTCVNVDVTRLEQVLINLCINARDALPSRGGRIHLQVKRPADRALKNMAVIVVEDNGSGMSQEVQQRMFEPFFTTKQPGSGTGLGLSMAIGVVEQLGGRIECQSELGRGTTFQISLPIVEQLSIAAKGDVNQDSDTQPLRILLVDDEDMIRKLGRAILNSLGHQAVTVTNGREAVDLLATDQAFDAVLLDLTMPVMSGKEAFREIRRRWPALPITICSGYLLTVEDWVDDSLGAPPSVLSKPYKPDDLNAHLKMLVSKTQL